jgi:hypothetical protein
MDVLVYDPETNRFYDERIDASKIEEEMKRLLGVEVVRDRVCAINGQEYQVWWLDDDVWFENTRPQYGAYWRFNGGDEPLFGPLVFVCADGSDCGLWCGGQGIAAQLQGCVVDNEL